MTVMKVDTTYEPYSKEPEYIDANRGLIATLDLAAVDRVADLACGTGLLSELLIERKPNLAICGIDIDSEQIEIAGRAFAERGLLVDSLKTLRSCDLGSGGAVHLREGSADELPFEDGELDLVVIGNAIHMMPDKDRFLAEVFRVLRGGGAFTFNSVFFAGTFPPGSENAYTEWLKEAVLVLDEKNRALAAAGEPRIKRVRGRGDRAFSKGWLTEDAWCAKVRDHGFSNVSSLKRDVPISRRGLELVGAYGGLAEVLMSGYPVAVASECLQTAVGRAFDRLGIDHVGRYWLEVVATKP